MIVIVMTTRPKRSCFRLPVEGWSDEESDQESTESLATSCTKLKLNLSLSKRKQCQERFEFLDKAESEALGKKYTPKNTDSSTKWAVATFLSWRDKRNSSFADPESQVPCDLLISTDTELLSKWLTYFVAEARRKDGENYPPKTVYLLLTGLLRHMRSRNVTCPNFLDTSDHRFSTFHNALDNVLRDLRMKGIGQSRQTEAFSKQDEEVLWESGVLSDDSPKSLLRAVFFLNGKNFCLRGGDEQRNLKISQLKRLSNPDRYIYTENSSKNRCGGLKQIRLQNKTVPIIAVPESQSRCHVYLLDKYFQKLPPKAIEKDNFYVQPATSGKQWFTARPIGRNMLSKMVKEICQEGGINGRKTNHSLRATGVSDLFQAGVPEKMIQERSGHLSLDGLRQYQRTTLMQDEAVSRVLTSGSSFQQNVFQSQHIVPQTPSPTVQNFSSCNVTIYNALPSLNSSL